MPPSRTVGDGEARALRGLPAWADRRGEGVTGMGWASAAIERLRQGQVVTLRPRGHSMAGKVNDGDLVTLAPLGGLPPAERQRGASA